LVSIFNEGKLRREATIRKSRIVRIEGARQVTREVEHYNLDAIPAAGLRVRSHWKICFITGRSAPFWNHLEDREKKDSFPRG